VGVGRQLAAAADVSARERLTKSKRVVVKIGSALLADAGDPFARLASQMVALRQRGIDVVLVSSGAIALGLRVLGYHERPRELAGLQACAAAGQSKLMARWDAAFATGGAHVAQILLTHDDLRDRRRYLNARHAFHALIERGCVPVVNENDTVAVDEIKLGDNDTLAAQVCGLVDADAVVLLTGASGLFTADPAKDATATRVPIVDDIAAVRAFAGQAAALGTGGMITKLDAAIVAQAHGAMTVICPGREPDVLTHVFAGDDIGTLVTAPVGGKERARKRWIETTLRARGTLIVDAGAVRALEKNASLLFAGVVRVDGEFRAGDAVHIADESGRVIAKGLCELSSDDARKVAGLRSDDARAKFAEPLPDELVHKDDLVLV
jgi:glutamate 5-kinase